MILSLSSTTLQRSKLYLLIVLLFSLFLLGISGTLNFLLQRNDLTSRILLILESGARILQHLLEGGHGRVELLLTSTR